MAVDAKAVLAAGIAQRPALACAGELGVEARDRPVIDAALRNRRERPMR